MTCISWGSHGLIVGPLSIIGSMQWLAICNLSLRVRIPKPGHSVTCERISTLLTVYFKGPILSLPRKSLYCQMCLHTICSCWSGFKFSRYCEPLVILTVAFK